LQEKSDRLGLRWFRGYLAINCSRVQYIAVLLPLSTTRFAAWCDRCLRGSEVVSCGAVPVARFVAIEHLRCVGWLHVAPADRQGPAREECLRMWSGETYCPECAGSIARTAPRARGAA
jgi:hypothetical protein